MDTLRTIMQKVDALSHEVALFKPQKKALTSLLASISDKYDTLHDELAILKLENKALTTGVNSINERPHSLPTQHIKQLTIDDINRVVNEKIASIKRVKSITESDIADIVDDKISNIKRQNTLTSDDVIFDIKNVVNIDYINKLYGK
tara:strand:+ start:127 stop:567 length:441 start_codon:yes stop_codon:yes gene_type:complete